MLYTLFLYQSTSGLLMYSKNFQEVGSGKMELFSSFFAAINSFVSELVLDGSKELQNISMGDYIIIVSAIKEVNVDIVIIADKDDSKLIYKTIPKIIKVLNEHKELLIEWKNNVRELQILDQPMSEIILSNKKLIGDVKSLTEDAEEFLKSMWSQRSQLKGELDSQQRQNLYKEREFLIKKLDEGKTTNLYRKLAISNKILKISDQLREESTFLEYQEKINNLKAQISDTKIKMEYYLKQIKESITREIESLGGKTLEKGDYKDCYLSLYSFSTKLKNISEDVREFKKYRDWANKLINREEIPIEELSDVIKNVLKMPDELEAYIELEKMGTN